MANGRGNIRLMLILCLCCAMAAEDTGTWKTAEFTLTQCRFMNRCNDADLRIVILGGELELAVGKIELMRTKITGEKQ